MNTLTKYGYPRLKNGFDPNMAQWRGSIIEVINIRFLKSEVCLDQWQTNSFSRTLPHLIGYALVFLFYHCDNKRVFLDRPIANTKM